MSEPRYQQLARTLIRAIRDQVYPVGSLLPPELELAAQHGVSRDTMRKALRQLQDQGLVSRRAGHGTRVEKPDEAASYRQRLASIEDLVQFGETHRRQIVRSEPTVVDIDTADELDCEPGSRWLWIGTVRIDRGRTVPEPVCWTDNYIDPLHDGIVHFVDTHPETLICTLIEREYRRRTLKVQQNVSATAMPAEAAQALAVPTHSPALRVIRHYSDELDDVFLVTRTFHAGDRYKLRSTLTHTA